MGGDDEAAVRHQEPPVLLQDLKVSILSSSILYPSAPTERRSMFLSNIDQVLNFSVETIHFFAANPDFPSHILAEKLSSAVERLLVPYDFLAGRLRINTTTPDQPARLEIDCNSKGVEFLLAQSNWNLHEIGELEYPNPAFRQLAAAAAGLPQNGLNMEDQSLCSFQLTFFKCGGFALGISNNHVTFDGISFKSFLENLASMVADNNHQQRPHQPFTNRQILSARSPPRVTFSHPELLETPSSAMLSLSPTEPLHFKLLRLSAANISSLKRLAKPRGAARASSFNVVVAHLWRCKSLCSSSSSSSSPEMTASTSMVLYAVDIRKRLSPPLPQEYAGNAVLTAYGEAAVEEVGRGDFGKLVEAVAKGADRMGDEYVRSVIDWGTLHRGIPKGDMFVSSWWRLGFAEVEYPWGKPLYTCPVAHPRRDFVLLFPSIQGADKGVNVLVALPAEEMATFEDLFNKLLPKPTDDD